MKANARMQSYIFEGQFAEEKKTGTCSCTNMTAYAGLSTSAPIRLMEEANENASNLPT